MKLYKISQQKNTDYDTFDSAIVVANSMDEAISIHPYGERANEFGCFEDQSDTWTEDVRDVTAIEIGEAHPRYTECEVILGSFNAG